MQKAWHDHRGVVPFSTVVLTTINSRALHPVSLLVRSAESVRDKCKFRVSRPTVAFSWCSSGSTAPAPYGVVHAPDSNTSSLVTDATNHRLQRVRRQIYSELSERPTVQVSVGWKSRWLSGTASPHPPAAGTLFPMYTYSLWSWSLPMLPR